VGDFIQNRSRNILINFRVSEKENSLIAEKMEAASIRIKESYLRRMVLDGHTKGEETNPQP